jgi:hypothetical protein
MNGLRNAKLGQIQGPQEEHEYFRGASAADQGAGGGNGLRCPARHRRLLVDCWVTHIQVQGDNGEGYGHINRGGHVRLDHLPANERRQGPTTATLEF